MVDVPPRWAFTIYAKLWSSFKEKSFTNTEANKIIKGNSNNFKQAFSRLKKNGWLIINLDQKDSRKSRYTLKNPLDIIEEMGGMR